MNQDLLGIVKMLLPIAVSARLFAQGLRLSPADLALIRQRPGLMLRCLLVVLVVVPLSTLGILLLLKPSPAVKIGLAILMACPPAPMMLVKGPKKGGSLPQIASLHFLFSLLALATVPLTLHLASTVLGFQAAVAESQVARVVGKTVLMPICLGLMMRTLSPRWADRISPFLTRVGAIAMPLMLPLIAWLAFGLLFKLDGYSYLVAITVVTASLALGHWLGPEERKERTTLAMESASRHPGLAMTIAVHNFDPHRALPLLVPYLFISILINSLYLKWRKRTSPTDV